MFVIKEVLPRLLLAAVFSLAATALSTDEGACAAVCTGAGAGGGATGRGGGAPPMTVK